MLILLRDFVGFGAIDVENFCAPLFHVEHFWRAGEQIWEMRRMFHVEHWPSYTKSARRSSPKAVPSARFPRFAAPEPIQSNCLTVQADQKDNAKDDRGEEDLYHVIVEDHLIGVGRGKKVTFSLVRGFPVNVGISGGCVLFGVHDGSPAKQDFSCILRTRNPAQNLFMGSSLVFSCLFLRDGCL
jgi:hypothetical protein